MAEGAGDAAAGSDPGPQVEAAVEQATPPPPEHAEAEPTTYVGNGEPSANVAESPAQESSSTPAPISSSAVDDTADGPGFELLAGRAQEYLAALEPRPRRRSGAAAAAAAAANSEQSDTHTTVLRCGPPGARGLGPSLTDSNISLAKTLTTSGLLPPGRSSRTKFSKPQVCRPSRFSFAN